jgi:DNA-binding transcriptional LysR family regulator
VSHFAGVAVIAPVWARFLSTFPDVQLGIHAAEALVDIVAKGFDAGIGSKDLAAGDMIAVRVMGPMRVTVVGAPAYFARRRPPRAPDDLARHSCVQYRLAADGAVFEWAFERDGKSRRIAVDGRVIVNDPDLAMRAAVDGLGIAYTVEALADPFLRSGQLVRVLEDWSPSGLISPGGPRRRNHPPIASRRFDYTVHNPGPAQSNWLTGVMGACAPALTGRRPHPRRRRTKIPDGPVVRAI